LPGLAAFDRGAAASPHGRGRGGDRQRPLGFALPLSDRHRWLSWWPRGV